jgi:hypothetical protein
VVGKVIITHASTDCPCRFYPVIGRSPSREISCDSR